MGMAAIAMVAITAVTTVMQRQQAAAQAKYQGRVAANNQKIADAKAVDATLRGELEERQHRIRVAQELGLVRAGAAQRGVLVDEGSAWDVTEDTVALGELEALTIRSNAAREAAGFRNQAAMMGMESEFMGNQASSLGGMNSILAGGLAGASVAAKWYDGQ